MVKLGYQVNNCDDLVVWITHSFGPECMLILITFGAASMLYLVYSLIRCIEYNSKRSFRFLRKLGKSTFSQIRTRFYPASTIRRRSARSHSYPNSSSLIPNRCFDRPDCPVPDPSIPNSTHNTSNPSPQDSEITCPTIPSDSVSTQLTTSAKSMTPHIPLAPLSTAPRRNPNRRRNSLM